MFSTETVIHLVRPECPQQLFIPIQVQISNEKSKFNVQQTDIFQFLFCSMQFDSYKQNFGLALKLVSKGILGASRDKVTNQI